MALGAFEAFADVTTFEFPDANALVQRAGSNVTSVRRDGNRRHSVLDLKIEHGLALLHVPQSNAAVAAARRDIVAGSSKIQGINVLLMAREDLLDRSRLDIPDL